MSDDDEQKGGEVIRFPRGGLQLEPFERDYSKPRPCEHVRIVVKDRGRDRFVRCGSCDLRLDPIAVVAMYADHERRFHFLKSNAEAKRAALNSEIEKLEKKKRRMQGQYRRLELRHPAFQMLKKLRAAAKDIPRKADRWPVESIERQLHKHLVGLLSVPPEQSEEASA